MQNKVVNEGYNLDVDHAIYSVQDADSEFKEIFKEPKNASPAKRHHWKPPVWRCSKS